MQRTLSISLVMMTLLASIIGYSMYLDVTKEKEGEGEKVNETANELDQLNTLCRFINSNCSEIYLVNDVTGEKIELENGANQIPIKDSGKYIIWTKYSGNLGSVSIDAKKADYCALIIQLELKRGHVVEVHTVKNICI